ncbi:RagB/SusD family nutrient uptake outer membrane protein [Hymenobacter sp. NST-14]|uniref:RagB/SusD family nutrient uptake outer membrane protein n=1 Tax=Hymenobacter piscis TaxID=2839984 RepID=UPI001C00AD26|nr:RagB/SusD family nutrient uptake outer membrane protein [Hymenobacter piscis]MBT9391655.1 RagB/SusD family nutrient uptake outer membrane protein [Hymenobacter piscis]
MYKNLTKALCLSGMVLSLGSCSFFELENVTDPNFPDRTSFLDNPTKAQLDFLATGTFSDLRTNGANTAQGIVLAYQVPGVIGREIYVLSTSDPRYVTELLGIQTIDNANYLSNYFGAYSSTRRTARTLADAAANSPQISEEQRNGYLGFANTAEAYAMLVLSDLQYENGLRVDVSDPLNPGKIKPYPEVLAAIKEKLDLGASQLAQAGSTLPFPVPSGFVDFNTPATMAQFNRALAARTAIRSNNYQDALAAVQASFFSLTASPTAGPLFNYGGANPDVFNSLFQVPNAKGSTVVVAHPSFITDIRPGDTRRSKVRERDLRSTTGLSSSYEPAIYATNTSPIPVIKNEELILIAAEAYLNTNNKAKAVEAINVLATAYGVAPVSVADNDEKLLNEILYHRRYSLFYEGQRWVDLRRLNRLGDIDPETTQDGKKTSVLTQMPLPFAEVQWDVANP